MYRTPSDLVSSYLTPQLGVGQRYRIETIRLRLSSLPIAEVLDLIGQISIRVDSATGHGDQLEIAEQLLPPALARRARNALERDNRLSVMSSQTVSILALHALLSCPDDGEAPPTSDLAHILGDLLLGLAGLIEPGSDDLVELVRAEMWSRVRDFDGWFEIAHRLFLGTLPALIDDPDWFDIRGLIEDAAGDMSLERFLGLTTSLALIAAQNPGGHVFPQYFESGSVSHEEVHRWMNVWSVSLSDARGAAANDVTDSGGWSFTAFYERPLVLLPSGRAILVRPWFLGMKATPVGLYSLVERLLRDAGADPLGWSRYFGRAVEHLGRELVAENMPSAERLDDEDSVRERWGPGKTCDLVVMGYRWLFVDFVFRRISRPTATTGSIDDLAKDLRFGVVEKLEQIDATIARAFASEAPPLGGAFPLVVIGAPFPTNGLAVNEIDQLLDAEHPTAIGVHPSVRPPTYMDLGEFALLCELTCDLDIHPADLIDRWVNSPMALSSFRNWVVTLGPGQPSPEGRRRYWVDVEKELFGAD